jgi:hypothetical protein
MAGLFSSVDDAVQRWWRTVEDALYTAASTSVHLDELLGSEYDSHRTIDASVRGFNTLLTLLGDRKSDLKALATFSLPDADHLAVEPPKLAELQGALDSFTPPELTIVRREVFGRMPVLMERYERPLGASVIDSGITCWFYQVWRPDSSVAEFFRGVSLQHFVDVPPGVLPDEPRLPDLP